MNDHPTDPADPRARPPRDLASVLGEVVAARGWQRRLAGARVHEHWEAIAGDQLAEHTEPVRLVGGVLVVRAATSAWATQLRWMSAELAARASRELGEPVHQVRVTAGPLQGDGG